VKRQCFLASLVIFSALVSPSFAKTIDHAEQYRACMKLVSDFPDEAFDAGLAWKDLGGGEAAEHCISAALIEMKNYSVGADRLEKLADESRRPKEFKAQILAQAAQAWFLADQIDRARAVLSTAIDLDNTQAEFYVDRAQMRSAQNAYTDALNDLDTALTIAENHVDALIFRGTVHRLVEHFENAWSDINRAVALEPGNPEALLERGMLNRIKGEDDQARKDWLDAISQDPQSPTAETARLNLERMDVNQSDQ